MKRIPIVLLALILCLCCFPAARAETGVNVEILKIDGVSVIVLTPEETVRRARDIAVEKGSADMIMPAALTLIGEEAFAGIRAETIEITENVVSIGPRAFADCKNLREITIPATVTEIDGSALSGCENVTVYGVKGSEAERFAAENGFAFAEIGGAPQEELPASRDAAPVQLPLVAR